MYGIILILSSYRTGIYRYRTAPVHQIILYGTDFIRVSSGVLEYTVCYSVLFLVQRTAYRTILYCTKLLQL